MSLIIKGMDMPLDCRFCPCCADNGLIGMEREYFCSAVDSALEIDKLDQKLSCCPLVEISTPHGRLIDADALLRTEINLANYPSNYVRIAPTIVEAEMN